MDGIIILNKPKGYTSHDVVSKVKKILKVKKVGHTGTLDPNATGVLPLLLGKGTQLSKYLIEHDKIYRATIKLGVRTDTLDGEGNIIEEKEISSICIEKENVIKTLNSFKGKGKQTPPMYSAIKVNGKKLYEYARKGEKVDVKPRDIEIYDINLEDIKNDEIVFKVHVSKGTYIRVLCDEIAIKLGTVGYMKELERLKVGKFSIENSITIKELEVQKENINDKIITIEEFFNNNMQINLNEKQLKLFLNGVCLSFDKPEGIYKIYDKENSFVGSGIIQNGLLKRDIIK